METQPGTHVFRGDLAHTPVPEILTSLLRHGIQGVLEATQRTTTVRVYVQRGVVVHATSSDLKDSLGYFLLEGGRIDEEQFEVTMAARAASSSARYGAVLVERSVLSPIEVQNAIRDQIENVLWGLFAWEEGTVTFQVAAPHVDAAVRIALPLRHVILEGIRRTPNAKGLVARLGKKHTVFTPTFQTEELIEVGLDAQEYRLLTMVDGRRSFLDLCQDGPLPPADNARLLYAFWVMNFIHRAEGAADEGA
jgi:hypothetical protein